MESTLAVEVSGLTGVSRVSGLDEGSGARYASCARAVARGDSVRASTEAFSSWYEGRCVCDAEGRDGAEAASRVSKLPCILVSCSCLIHSSDVGLAAV